MDFLDELEVMVANANCSTDDQQDERIVISKWMNLFDYTEEEAGRCIAQQRQDLTSLVSDDLWQTVREQQEKLGHDRQSYSHWLRIPRRPSAHDAGTTAAGKTGTEYLVKLGGPLESPELIAAIARLPSPPPSHRSSLGTDDGEPDDDDDGAVFCRIDGMTKQAVTSWLSIHHPSYRPLFVALNIAAKDLSANSLAPALGFDPTLPQYRMSDYDYPPAPAQAAYPVWYFFYGTLADTERLRGLFRQIDEADKDYELYPAIVANTQLTRAGKYNALINGSSEVQGWAFRVQSREHEDALRAYETNAYEVVRCRIVFEEDPNTAVWGCTFRFVQQV